MKMIAECLEHAIQFERMAAEATDATLKARMLEQAKSYRKLAEKAYWKLADERAARPTAARPVDGGPPQQPS
jgi:hypothetical protein